MAHPSYPPMNQPFYPPMAAPPPSFYPPPPAPEAAQPYYPFTQESATSTASYTQASAAYWPPQNPVPAVSQAPATIATPVPVVGPQYCLPRPVDLMVVRKLMTLTDDFAVTDVQNNTMFKVKGKLLSLHEERVLLDASGRPVLTLRQKIMTAHKRWQAFRGGSSHPADLMFSAKTSSVVQLKTKLNVYLGNRAVEDCCDFKVEGSWSDRSCVVYVGESTTVAAQMRKKDNAQSFFLGKDTFMISVSPNIDYAFVVALILILDDAVGSSPSSDLVSFILDGLLETIESYIYITPSLAAAS